MEDDFNGRRPQWKTTQWKLALMEDNINGRQHQWKTTQMEDKINGTSIEDDLNGGRLQC